MKKILSVLVLASVCAAQASYACISPVSKRQMFVVNIPTAVNGPILLVEGDFVQFTLDNGQLLRATSKNMSVEFTSSQRLPADGIRRTFVLRANLPGAGLAEIIDAQGDVKVTQIFDIAARPVFRGEDCN